MIAKDRATAVQEQPDSANSAGGAAATGSGGAVSEASGGAAEESGGAPSGTGGYIAEATGGTNGEAAATTGGATGHVAPKPADSGAPMPRDAGGPFMCPSTCEVAQLRSHGASLADPFSVAPGMEVRTCLAYHVETESPTNLVALTFVLGDARVSSGGGRRRSRRATPSSVRPKERA